jgi:hypothetical protein
MSLEMAHKVILPPKKNYIPQFLKQRDINSYYGVLLITARPSMFPVGSLGEFLIPIGPFVRSKRLKSTRASYVVVNYHLHVTYNFK